MLHDLSQAARTLRAAPGFSATAVLILALGLGANLTVFAVANAVFFKGLPGVDDSRFVYIGTQKDGRGCCVSLPDLHDWRAQAQSLNGIAAVADQRITLEDDTGLSDATSATRMTANTFALLGYTPLLGRNFESADDVSGAAPVALLSYRFWERRYGRDPSVIGRRLRVNGVVTTVIGVMPRAVGFPQNQDIWLPLAPTPELERRDARTLWFALGRLAPTAAFDTVRAELAAIGARLAREHPATNAGWVPAPQRFAEFFVARDAARTYGTLWAAVACVLLIACANVANLVMGRTLDRGREVALRLALGAGAARVIRQLLAESLIIGLLGAGVGLLLANAALIGYAAVSNPPALAWSVDLLDYSLDTRAFAYLVTITLVAVCVSGTVPALRAIRTDVHATLREGGRGAAPGAHRSAGLLVAAQVALALILLTAAGALARNYLAMAARPLGAETGHVLTMLVNRPAAGEERPTDHLAFFDRAAERLRRIPGVEFVSTTNVGLTAGAPAREYEAAGAAIDTSRRPTVSLMTVGAGYFATMGVRIAAGRDFAPQDAAGRPVAIVNQRFAELHWPGEDATGRLLRLPSAAGDAPWMSVIGVAPNLAQNDAWRSRDDFDPLVYVPFSQHPSRGAWILIRTLVPPASLAAAARAAVHEIDPALPVWSGPFPLDTWLASMGAFWQTRINTSLLTIFAAAAVLLSGLGVYAVLAHAVGRRRKEIAVRMAVGGSVRDVMGLIVRQGMRSVGVGVAVGLPVALSFSRSVGPERAGGFVSHAAVIGVGVTVLLAAAVLACLLPARRASQVDPMIVLRDS